MRIDWKVVLGLVISALFLWWAFRGEDLAEIWRLMISANVPWLLATGAMAVVGALLRAIRWELFLRPTGEGTSLYSRWASINIGLMVTKVYPARLGEIARPFALSRMTPVPMSAALGTVVLERVLDTFALLVLLLFALLSPAFPDDATVLGRSIEYAALGAIVLCAAGLVAVSVLILWPHHTTRLVQGLSGVLPARLRDRVVREAESFLSGLNLLRSPRALIAAILWSLVVWLWMSASFWAGFKAFDIDLGATAAVFAQCSVAVFVALPAAPGFIGTLQAGVAVSVGEVFGIAAEPTLSLAIGYHLIGFAPVTLLGLYYASRLGLHLTSMEADVEQARRNEA